MRPREDHERVGVLVVSLRRTEAEARLIAQLTAITALDAEQQVLSVPGDPDVVLARVREWLLAVAAGESLRW
jgi:hypothetical protein